MKTTSGSLSLLSATNRWCFGDAKEGSQWHACCGARLTRNLRQHHPNGTQFPYVLARAARTSCSPKSLPPLPVFSPGLRSIAGGVAHQGHPAPVALHVLYRRGLAGWVLVSTHLGALAPAGRASAVGGRVFREEVAPPRPPLPLRQQWTVRSPHFSLLISSPAASYLAEIDNL